MLNATREQIEKALKLHQEEVANVLTKQSITAHIAGDLKAYKVLKSPAIAFNLVQKEAIAYGKKYGTLLKKEGASIIDGKKVKWLAEGTARTREEVSNIINEGLRTGKPIDKIGRELRETLIRDKNYEYKRIARTEVARIQSEGSTNRYKANDVKNVKWLCGPNPCPICAQYCNNIYNINDVPTIPVHPNCTCDKAPVITRTVRETVDKKAAAIEKSIKKQITPSKLKAAPKKPPLEKPKVAKKKPVAPKEKPKVTKKTSIPETTKENSMTITTDKAGITKKLESRGINHLGTQESRLKLSFNEANSANHYQGSGFTDINNGLRGKTKLTKGYKAHVKNMDSALSKSKVPEDVQVFRGMSANQAEIIKKTNGCINKGYTSTTYNPDNAFTFATRGEDKYFNLMQMKVKKDTKALMWPGGENEVMLERGLKLKCTGIKEINNFAMKSGAKAADKVKKVRIFIMEAV